MRMSLHAGWNPDDPESEVVTLEYLAAMAPAVAVLASPWTTSPKGRKKRIIKPDWIGVEEAIPRTIADSEQSETRERRADLACC